MNKLLKIMGVVLVAIMIFIVGYLTGSINTNEVTKEIRIGYQNSNHLNRVDYYNIFTDVENPSIIERISYDLYKQRENRKCKCR